MNRREELRAAREARRRAAGGPSDTAEVPVAGRAFVAPEMGTRENAAAGQRAPRAADQTTAPSPAATVDGDLERLQKKSEAQAAERGSTPTSSVPQDLVLDNTKRLAQRIQEKRNARDRAGQRLSAREAEIRRTYAPDIVQQVDEYRQQQSSNGPVSRPAQGTSESFSRDRWIASLISHSKSNFLKVDEQLSQERQVAVQQLHSSVFSHATDFMLLFREVEQASSLVESLKNVVQTTKGLISSVGRFSLLSVMEDAGGGSASTSATARKKSSWRYPRYQGLGWGPSSHSLTELEDRGDGGGGEDGLDVGELVRPSLITRRLYQDTAVGSSSAGELSASPQRTSSPGALVGVGVSRASTRSLNVDSFLEWRHRIGTVDLSADFSPAAKQKSKRSLKDTARSEWRRETHAIRLFSLVLREEFEQLLAERRYQDGGVVLRDMRSEALKKHSLPLLLQLESALVNATLGNLQSMPPSPMYVESLHVPLLQLLLSFGRHRIGSVAYLELQTQRMERDLRGLQSHLDPKYATLTLMDYLVRSMKDTLDRQRTLHLPLESFQAVQRQGLAENSSFGLAGASVAQWPAAGSAKKKSLRKESAEARPPELLPLHAAALLFVRDSIDRYADQILNCCVLSQSTEADGAIEPTRLRRAVSATVEILAVLRSTAETHRIFAGCDALALRSLTSNIVRLQKEFSSRTRVRLSFIAHSTISQGIGDVVYLQQQLVQPPAKAGDYYFYCPSECEDAARCGTLCGQEVWKRLRHLPPCSCVALLGLLLSPASCYLFDRDWLQTFGRRWWLKGRAAYYCAEGATEPSAHEPYNNRNTLLSSEIFSFLRYTNSPTPVLSQVLEAVLHFTAATTGSTQLPQRPLSAPRHNRTPDKDQESVADPSQLNYQGLHQVGSDRTAQNVEVLQFEQQRHAAESVLRSSLVADALDSNVTSLLIGHLDNLRTARRMLLQFLCSPTYRTFHTQQRLSHREVAASSSDGARVQRRRPSLAVLAEEEDEEEVQGYSESALRQRTGPLLSHDSRPGNVDSAHRQRMLSALLPGPQPLFTNFTSSPAWVFDTFMALLTDAIAVAVMGLYGSAGGFAMLLGDTAFAFRTKYLHRLSGILPSIVQGWLTCALALGRSVRDGVKAITLCESSVKDNPCATPQDGYSREPARTFEAHPKRRDDPLHRYTDIIFSVGSEQKVLRGVITDLLGEGYRTPSDYVLHHHLPFPVTRPSVRALFPTKQSTAQEEEALRGRMLSGTSDSNSFARASRPFQTTPEASIVRHAGVWVVRRHLSRYPLFPIGNTSAAILVDDELFLLHWATQTTLHLLTMFQERLLIPSYVTNKRFMDAQKISTNAPPSPLPVRGCATPQEPEGKLSFLSGGGGGQYGAAVASLQFILFRVFRDGICRPSTWTAVYGCHSVEEWRANDKILRQQIFYFAFMLRMWSPLFVGGLDVPIAQEEKSWKQGDPGSPSKPEKLAGLGVPKKHSTSAPIRVPSDIHTDQKSALEVLQWLTCPECPGTGGSSAAPAKPNIFLERDGNPDADLFGMNPWSAPSSPNSTSSPLLGSPSSCAGAELEDDDVCYAPPVLLQLVKSFFEQLQEYRAVPAILSAVTRQRVDRAMQTFNLKDFMDVKLDPDDESEDDDAGGEESSEEDEEELDLSGTMRESRLHDHEKNSSGLLDDGAPLTLEHLREMLITYVLPLL